METLAPRAPIGHPTSLPDVHRGEVDHFRQPCHLKLQFLYRRQFLVALFPICLCTYFTGSPRHHVRGKCLLGPQLLNTVLVGLVACWEKMCFQ